MTQQAEDQLQMNQQTTKGRNTGESATQEQERKANSSEEVADVSGIDAAPVEMSNEEPIPVE